MARWSKALVMVVCLGFLLAGAGLSEGAKAQRKSGRAVAAPAKGAASRAKSKRPTRAASKRKPRKTARPARLPRHYSKLELTDRQREKVLAIQAAYRAKSQDLRKQLDTVVADRERELARVLKPAQRTKLKRLAGSRSTTRGKARKAVAKGDKASKRPRKT